MKFSERLFLLSKYFLKTCVDLIIKFIMLSKISLLISFCYFISTSLSFRLHLGPRRINTNLFGFTENLVTATLTACLSIAENPTINFPPTYSSLLISDSTGKMSTKMTAKRRYIPRIKVGVTEFLGVASNNEFLDLFIKEKLPDLERAMSLYGASLRKGEYPDEISRKAEKLTQDFVSKFENLNSKSPDIQTRLADAKVSLDSYLEFVKLPTSSSQDYIINSK